MCVMNELMNRRADRDALHTQSLARCRPCTSQTGGGLAAIYIECYYYAIDCGPQPNHHQSSIHSFFDRNQSNISINQSIMYVCLHMTTTTTNDAECLFSKQRR
eukprot:GHVU01094058.1.p1 GENE.GHVU01094058.1~~GHVU01094058.1.p1  ORF type:complete len:103 (-),score=6.36 GHVU01094058.1:189-497(-)